MWITYDIRNESTIPPPPTCRTDPEIGEQVSKPIWAVLSCICIASTFWKLHMNQAEVVNISVFNEETAIFED